MIPLAPAKVFWSHTHKKIIAEKQKEYQQYHFDMVGDEVEIDTASHKITKQINVIDMAFDAIKDTSNAEME